MWSGDLGTQSDFCLFHLISSRVYSGGFQKLYDMGYYSRLSAEADIRIQ